MEPERVILSPDDAALIRAYARAAYPQECCGLLLGKGEVRAGSIVVGHIVAAANVAADPLRHFAIDPQFLFDRHRSVRETNMRIIGHYHSHPNGRAEPSGEDLAMAHEPGAVWIIAAVAGNGATLRAYVPVGTAFAEIPILSAS
ncbi:MAG: M67 family metallopeptidase [Rhodospirillaceae bacterium]